MGGGENPEIVISKGSILMKTEKSDSPICIKGFRNMKHVEFSNATFDLTFQNYR